jgi:molybdopterin converting factor small subunit
MTATGKARRPSEAPAGRVRLLLFATARTTVGTHALAWPVAAHGTTVRELLADLARVHPRVAPILTHCRFFLDGVPVARLDERVRPGVELAIHPPYGGG